MTLDPRANGLTAVQFKGATTHGPATTWPGAYSPQRLCKACLSSLGGPELTGVHPEPRIGDSDVCQLYSTGILGAIKPFPTSGFGH